MPDQYNDLGELITPEDVDEQAISAIDYSTDSFTVKLEDGGYLQVDPEFAPYKGGIMTTGRFHCYLVDVTHGTSTFYIEQDANMVWKSEIHPHWVDQKLIDFIGQKIEGRE